MPWTPYRWALAGIVVLALGLRLVVAVGVSRDAIVGDPAFYDRIAVSVAAGEGWPRIRGQETALHPPAWPYVLGATYALASPSSREGRWRAGRVVNAVLGAAAAGLVGLLALALWGSAVSLAAAGLAAVYPPGLTLGATLYSEPLFVVLELGALLAVLAHRGSSRRWRWILVAGVLTGLAALTRPNGAALLLPFALAVWTARPRWSREALAAPAALVAAAALTVAPWTLRNLLVLKAPVPVSTNIGKTLAGTYNPVARGHRYRWITGRLLPRSYRPALARPTEPARSVALTRLALDYIAHNPLAVVKAGIWNTARLAELDPPGRRLLEVALGSRRLARVSILGFGVVALLAAAGLFTRRARDAPALVWLVPGLLWLSVAPIAVNFSRFRAPLDPFLILLAALAVTAAAGRAGKLRWRHGHTSRVDGGKGR